MKLTETFLAISFVALVPGAVFSSGDSGGINLEPGARFEFSMQSSGEYSPFPWNYNSSSRSDRSRLMLDLGIGSESFGSVYIKGDGVWDLYEPHEGKKILRFRQADYFWRRPGSKFDLSFRLFANERRFFSGEYLAPLLYDDYVGEPGENRGIRFEGSCHEKFYWKSVWAAVGKDWENARQVSFVKSSYLNRYFHLSLSYLFEVPPEDEALRHAVFKSELLCFYKRASFILSYEQSGYKNRGPFFPDGKFSFGEFNGDNFSGILPGDGAFFAEARMPGLPIMDFGDLSFVPKYFAVGGEFMNDFGMKEVDRVGYLLSAYFKAKRVDLNGRLSYGESIRSHWEKENTKRAEGSIWGRLKNGIGFELRSLISKSEERGAVMERSNRTLLGVNLQTNRLRNGFRIMLKDIDTIFSGGGLGWDSRIALNSDFAVELRFILSRVYSTQDAVFARLEFRPNKFLYAYFSYGRKYLGDGPFMLEDKDLNLSRLSSDMYTLSLRGDF